MKKIILCNIFLCFCLFSSKAQNSSSTIFNGTSIVWYGIDFSNVRLIGSDGFTDLKQIKDYYFDQWNEVIVAESEKYDIKKFYSQNTVVNEIDAIKAHNDLPKIENLVSNSDYVLERSKVDAILKGIKNSTKSGIGLVFIAEKLSKTEEKAYVYVTFFDISSKKVLLCEKVSGSASGFGFRNYWLGAFYSIMKNSQKSWKTWMSQSSANK